SRGARAGRAARARGAPGRGDRRRAGAPRDVGAGGADAARRAIAARRDRGRDRGGDVAARQPAPAAPGARAGRAGRGPRPAPARRGRSRGVIGATGNAAESPRVGPVMPRILVVDDEAHIREVVAYALTIDGFEVVTVDNGRAALA